MSAIPTRTLELLNGKLYVPTQLLELSDPSGVYHSVLESFFDSLWYNYLQAKNSVALPYWSDKVGNPKVFNKFLKHLSKAGWITTKVEVGRHWAEAKLNDTKLLKWVSEKDLVSIRKEHKFSRYKLENKESKITMLTKTSTGKIDYTGLQRKGFAKAGNNAFSYDTAKLLANRDTIIANVTKGIRKMNLDYSVFNDNTDYESIATELVDFYIYDNSTYTLGNNISDSRGRAISSSLSKIGNPLGFKDFRACLVPHGNLSTWILPNHDAFIVLPKTNDEVYAFIAELLGHKRETIGAKKLAGMSAYNNREYHELDLTNEDDQAELHENIWLERLYNMLDAGELNVPIEKDFTASILQIEGLLLDHAPYLDETNVIGDTLKDIWTVDGIPRKQVKFCMTPSLYGSSQSPQALWLAKKIKYTTKQVSIANKMINTGKFAVANKFKDFIINNVKPKEEMEVIIFNERFTIQCNRFKHIGEYAKKYDLYDTKTDSVLTISHVHTKSVPDLEQFRRYFVTLLVHNLDSQVADFICMNYEDVHTVEQLAKDFYTKIYNNREQILTAYFSSIGIDFKSSVEWSQLKELLIPVEQLNIKDTLLK